MTTPKPLSPAAQAVQDAAYRVNDPRRSPHDELDLPAAIRRLADEVVPSTMCSARTDRGLQRTMIRNEILLIAAELKGSP
jgi:hypothetical protein